jgi:hypothetical protein
MMQSLGLTKFKKLNPRQGYLAPYIQLPWGYGEELIGKEIEIFETNNGFSVRFTDEKFKQPNTEDLETRLQLIEEKLEQLSKYASKTGWARRDLNTRSSPCEGDVITS